MHGSLLTTREPAEIDRAALNRPAYPRGRPGQAATPGARCRTRPTWGAAFRAVDGPLVVEPPAESPRGACMQAFGATEVSQKTSFVEALDSLEVVEVVEVLEVKFSGS